MTDHEDDMLPHWTSEELALLRSAETDAPSVRSLPATLAAVGVGGAIAASSAGVQAAASAGAAASAPASAVGGASASAATGAAGGAAAGVAGTSTAVVKAASIALGKWIAVAAISGAVVTGGIVLSKRLPARDHPVPQLNRHTQHAAARPSTSPQPAAPAMPAAVPADQPALRPAAEPARVPARAARQSSASAIAAREPPAQPDIRREIAALDSARASLRNGHAREALAALDRYDASFGPDAALQLEASTLRIEALAQSGDRTKAEALARTFLKAHPNTPYATRIRALLTPTTPNR